MKTMKKTILVSILCLALGLVACDNKGGKTEGTDSTKTEKKDTTKAKPNAEGDKTVKTDSAATGDSTKTDTTNKKGD